MFLFTLEANRLSELSTVQRPLSNGSLTRPGDRGKDIIDLVCRFFFFSFGPGDKKREKSENFVHPQLNYFLFE